MRISIGCKEKFNDLMVFLLALSRVKVTHNLISILTFRLHETGLAYLNRLKFRTLLLKVMDP